MEESLGFGQKKQFKAVSVCSGKVGLEFYTSGKKIAVTKLSLSCGRTLTVKCCRLRYLPLRGRTFRVRIQDVNTRQIRCI